VTADPVTAGKIERSGIRGHRQQFPSYAGIKDNGADPKDKVEVVNLLHRAEMAKEDMRFQEAVPLLERVIALEPNLPITYLQLGTALSSLKDYGKAVPILRKAVEMRPDLTVTRYQLGLGIVRDRRFWRGRWSSLRPPWSDLRTGRKRISRWQLLMRELAA